MEWLQQGKSRPYAPPNSDFRYPVKINRTRRVIGHTQSMTTGQSNPFHSGIELSWLLLLDLTPGVKSYAAQTDSFRCVIDGVESRYTPDTRVDLNDGSTVYVEVKSLEVSQAREFQVRWQRLMPLFRRAGLRLHLVTDQLVQAPIIDENVRRLQSFRSVIPDEAIALQLFEKLATTRQASIGNLIAGYPDQVAARQTVKSLILRKRLATNIEIPIDDRSLVFIPDPLINPFTE